MFPRAATTAALYDAAMPIDVSGRRVFLASPGDMTSERETCRKVIREFNEARIEFEQVTFIVRAWEDLPGGVGRPQDRINPKLDDCDYMILILGDRWGSPPAVDGPYSSGTEEEFHRCVDLLAQPDAAMRDLLVLFKTLDADRLRDPGSQLLKVMNFRASLEASKSLQYMTFDSDESLSTAIGRKLVEWSDPLTDRELIKIALPEAVGSVEPPIQATHEQLLVAARDHAASGHLMQAEAAFAHAIKDGDVDALSEYALFMRRTGRLEQALELNQQVIDDPKILSATDRDSLVHRVKALSNMGVIHRKRGSLSDSIGALREAVHTAQSSNKPIYQDYCYALDNYGLSLLRSNNVNLANAQFEKAQSLRTEFGTRRDLAQSAVNLGRQSLLFQDYERASVVFSEALGNPDIESDERLLANALCGLAEARLRQRSGEGVERLLARALELNTNLGNSDGVSIAHGLLARLFLLENSPELAVAQAELCQQESDKTNSSTGQGTAALLLALAGLARGRRREAREYLVQARQYSRKSGNEPLIKEVDATVRQLAADDSED